MGMARGLWTGALLALALGACEEQPRETAWGPIPPRQGEEAPPERLDTTFMQGEWKLATMGAWPPQRGTPDITVDITADRIEATSQCKRMMWTYVLTEQSLETTPAPDGEPECEREMSVWELAFEEAITRARRVEMLGDGGLAIEGAGGEVELSRR